MLDNKTILLTGATDGIGKQTSILLAKNGAVLLITGKNKEKGIKTRSEIIDRTHNQDVFYFNADFTSLYEVQQLSDKIHEKFSHIDILINNAGIYENERIILENGLEKTFVVNYLAAFSLTLNLLDRLQRTQEARIINVSSMIHASTIDFENLNAEKFYSAQQAYCLSKLLNILFTYELSDRLKGKRITVNALHPGVINTKLLRAGWGASGASPLEGAKRIFYLAASDEVAGISGRYFVNNKPARSAEISYDKRIRAKLWDLSTRYIAVKGRGFTP